MDAAARDYDADIARLRAFMVYADLSIRAVAKLAGVSHIAVELINFPERFHPRPSTLVKLVAIIPPAFSERRAGAEYIKSCARVRAWFKKSGLKRYQLESLGIQYGWVRHIDDDTWSPSWFALRKLLALIERQP